MSRRISPLGKMARLPAKLAQRAREQGVGAALGWCWYQAQWRWREWRMGIDTREFSHGVVVEDQGEHHGYEPIEHRTFDIILGYLDVQPDRESFIDYGCGMGRAVVLAARKPFQRVIGVEIDERLAEIARKQIDNARRRGCLRCEQVEIAVADASAWQVPADVTCVFLYNSFVGELLDTVLERIRESVAAAPRALKLIYVHPVANDDYLAAVPWLARRRELSTGYWTHIRTVVYEAVIEKAAEEPAHSQLQGGRQ